MILKFSFFEKNVNKQLKSADFFTEMSKFQKSILRKILSFFILISKHTFIFIVHPPNMKYLIFQISIFCYLCLNPNGKNVIEKFNLFYTPDVQTVLHQLDSSYNPTENCQHWIYWQPREKSEKFFCVTDQNVIVARYMYRQCKVFGISISTQFILVFLQ